MVIKHYLLDGTPYFGFLIFNLLILLFLQVSSPLEI